jgi:hypothetical protein
MRRRERIEPVIASGIVSIENLLSSVETHDRFEDSPFHWGRSRHPSSRSSGST